MMAIPTQLQFTFERAKPGAHKLPALELQSRTGERVWMFDWVGKTFTALRRQWWGTRDLPESGVDRGEDRGEAQPPPYGPGNPGDHPGYPNIALVGMRAPTTPTEVGPNWLWQRSAWPCEFAVKYHDAQGIRIGHFVIDVIRTVYPTGEVHTSIGDKHGSVFLSQWAKSTFRPSAGLALAVAYCVSWNKMSVQQRRTAVRMHLAAGEVQHIQDASGNALTAKASSEGRALSSDPAVGGD